MATGKIRNHDIQLETLFQAENITGADFDGVYIKNPTNRTGDIQWIGLYKFGRVVYLTVYMNVAGALSANSLSSLFELGELVAPIRALRVPAILNSPSANIGGVVSLAASNGQVSFSSNVDITNGVAIRFSATFMTAEEYIITT